MSSSMDQKPITIESVLEELSSSKTDPSMIVNPPNWNHIPLLIREWDGKDETLMCRLLDEMSRILTFLSDSDLPLANKRLLHSTLFALSQSADKSKKVITRARQCLLHLESIQDAITRNEATRQGCERGERKANEGDNTVDQGIGRAETQACQFHNLDWNEVEKLNKELTDKQAEMDTWFDEVSKLNDQADRATNAAVRKMESLRLQLEHLPIWVGTRSLQTFDETAHTLWKGRLVQNTRNTPGVLRTAFTFPIETGEWELKIRAVDGPVVCIGFIRHPLPEGATHFTAGAWTSGFGGCFLLWSGAMWKGGEEFKPKGTNTKINHIGQTAAIRVNMATREARLFVDDEEQPGIFTDIPSPLCLSISTGFQDDNQSVRVLWLKQLFETELARRETKDSLETEVVREDKKLTGEAKELTLPHENLPIWVGTESIRTIDETTHKLTPTTLTQIVVPPGHNPWRTAFTRPINKGEWELKIRGDTTSWRVKVGYLLHPLREFATQESCGDWESGIGGDFSLWNGKMHRAGKTVQTVGTNKKCERAGQTAAIRVNMWKREARLFVDDEEQPGIFTDIPSPLCLAISTGSEEKNQEVEVLGLTRLF
ncbi:hypothetical protein BLNAU_5255 [Blattamonas nauphoetae]|uniref:Uncharacterized protein n=1 Tax=Blattamonas nauphoetae TaxID=2049346 RepID=A0ABQ9Y7R0_9EUKA|nr:hypothetical protein BLNAU_5255 [Blattamonas nauphoetae]